LVVVGRGLLDTRAARDLAGEDADFRLVKGKLFGPVKTEKTPLSFELDFASQGHEGWALVQGALREGRPYALAFVDIRMPPGWDGIETISKIWQADPEIQMVICTAYSDHSWSEIAGTLGHPDNLLILTKPFEDEQLLEAMWRENLGRLKALAEGDVVAMIRVYESLKGYHT
jgi:CheY-like chemotaxis protein